MGNTYKTDENYTKSQMSQQQNGLSFNATACQILFGCFAIWSFQAIVCFAHVLSTKEEQDVWKF